MNFDEVYIQRCLELAALGRYSVAPNPMVGCVIVYQGKIIGEGYHHHAGGPHAEVVAIQAAKDQALLKESTLYVSLEPCAHHGRTPPCSDLIIEKGIPTVVIATRDSHAAVNGKGIQKLKAAGIEVRESILQKQAQDLNRIFFTFHGKKRPFITLKWAESADGFIDPPRNANSKGVQWITAPETQVYSHQLRATHQAILVGRKTVEIDDPSLNCRAFAGKDPLRIIIDPHNRLDHRSYKVFRDSHYLRFCKTPLTEQDRALSNLEAPIPEILDMLFQEEVSSLLVEGGAKTLSSFIESGYWDEAQILKAPHSLGSGLKAPKIERLTSRINLGTDELLKIGNPWFGCC